MTKFDLTRRQALATAGATLAGAALAKNLLGSTPAAAKAPFSTATPARFYNFKHGDMQISVVSDGPLPFGDGRKTMHELSMEEMAKRLEANFLPADNMVLEQNITVVNNGSKLVVFDTGMGASKMFGDTTGRLPKNLVAAGINPADVDAVVISHCHPDHAGGLVDAAGKSVFPNAQVFVNETDYNFWTDEAKLSNEGLKPLVELARANLLPHKDKITFIKGGQEIITGITTIDAPGHTPGHTAFMLNSANKPLALTCDAGHHYVLFLETPRIEFSYDIDPKLAVQSRLKMWDMLSADRIPFIAYHFPFPGLGNIAKTGNETYHWFPTPVSTF
jgi:glyoxylase-like metal-dependent hydrolase (beta-lactamase superfamily II)